MDSDELSVKKKKSNLEQSLLGTYTEPTSHKKRKGILEKIFGGVIQSINYDLTNQEIQLFRELQLEYNDSQTLNIKHFENENPEHNKLITSLYYQVSNEVIEENQINGDHWQKLGFQQANPRTDFRGAGLPAAKHILQFVESNIELVQQKMISGENYFFFAINSIKVSDYILTYFHIPKNSSLRKDLSCLCTRKAFKNFCRMLARNPMIIYDIHDILLKHLFLNHIELMKKYTIQQFLQISDKQRCQPTWNRLATVLENKNYSTFEQFENDFWGKKKSFEKLLEKKIK